jgi:hypothetical protein
MSNVVTPIHTAPLGKSTVRFFRSPLASPDLPWHVPDDLAACMGLPRAARREFRHMLMSGPFKADVRVVATTGGIVTIAPHSQAQGLIGGAIDAGMHGGPAFLEAYIAAAIVAWKALTADLPPLAAVELAIAATKTSLEVGS